MNNDAIDPYIPIKSEEFDLSVGEDGNVKFKDRSGMTGRARRSGGILNGVFGAAFWWIGMSVITGAAMMLMPASWPPSVRHSILWVGIVATIGGSLVILSLYIRRKWLRWALFGIVGVLVLVAGLGQLALSLL